MCLVRIIYTKTWIFFKHTITISTDELRDLDRDRDLRDRDRDLRERDRDLRDRELWDREYE